MPILGTLLKKGINLRETLEQLYTLDRDLQQQELRKLLIYSEYTQIGKHYDFERYF